LKLLFLKVGRLCGAGVYYDKNFGPTPDDLINDSQMQAVFPWANHPYYHSALPYLPINGVL
jgi:hypothetical protein